MRSCAIAAKSWPSPPTSATLARRNGSSERPGPPSVVSTSWSTTPPSRARWPHLLDETPEGWDEVIRSNLTSVFLCTRLVARGLVDAGLPGAIVNISSFAAHRAHREMGAYDASKGGIEAFTRSAALDLAPYRIRVNAVAPGAIATGSSGEDPEARERRGVPIPAQRVGEPEEVAAASCSWHRTRPRTSRVRRSSSMAG